MENQNILRIVLSLAILVAFFLPLSSESATGDNTSESAWNLLTGSVKNFNEVKTHSTSQLITVGCLAVVFVCIVVILILSVLHKQTSVFLNLVPLLAIIVLIVFNTTQAKENVSQTLQTFGSGFYIMFLSSFLLPFTSFTITNSAKA